MKSLCSFLAILSFLTLLPRSDALPVCEPVAPTVMLLDGDTERPITVEEYVAGVVAHEVPYTFHPEAIKAQAVAARTYLYYCLENGSHPHKNADVCTDAAHCVGYVTETELAARYGTDAAVKYMEAARAAAYATEGEILTYDGGPLLSVWHSSSSGRTEDCAAVWMQSLPYLVSVDTPEEAAAQTVSFTQNEITRRLMAAGYKYNGSLTVMQTATDTGRCATLTLGNITLDGGEARRIFGLRSTDLRAFTLGGRVYFSTQGYGHGVGMSQYGADAMARSGADYKEILVHYYPTGEIMDES